MNVTNKFMILFIGFILIVICSATCIGIFYINNLFTIFLNTKHIEFLPIMANNMVQKAIISFVIYSSIMLILSIPLGIILIRFISKPYLKIFSNITEIAHKRLFLENQIDKKSKEFQIIDRYIELLHSDFEKIKLFEKEKGWKEGAKILMHELRNPLTPLKLSCEQLSIHSQLPAEISDEIKKIAIALYDTEKILGHFKELVNIEFGPKTNMDIRKSINDFYQECITLRPFALHTNYLTDTFDIIAEPSLIKMLFLNLISNGLDANREMFHVVINELDSILTIQFITPDRTIPNDLQLYKIGSSTKGKGHGYGLFLCRKISEYLDLNLRCYQDNKDIIFSIDFKRIKKNEK